MSEFVDRIRVLSPEQLELLARRLGASPPDAAPAPVEGALQQVHSPQQGHSPTARSGDAGALRADREPLDGGTARRTDQRDPEALLRRVDELSEGDVDWLLQELLGADDKAATVAEAVQDGQAGAGRGAVPQASAEDLLAQIDTLSDESVDSLLHELMGDEGR